MLSMTQAAKELGLTRQRVHILIQEKRLPAKLDGQQWTIERDDLKLFAGIERKGGRPKNHLITLTINE